MQVQLIYISTPIPKWQDQVDLDLPISQELNKLNGITGMVMSTSKFYLQLIEGKRDKVNALYNKIVADPRHKDVVLLKYQDIRRAEFPDWNIAVIGDDCNSLVFLHEMISMGMVDAATMTGATAISILRRAAAILASESHPNRRKTDVAYIPVLSEITRPMPL